MELRLVDMHCHLEAFDEPRALARELEARGIAALAVSVSPASYENLAERMAGGADNIWQAAGLHPWGFAEGADCEPAVERMLELAGERHLIGEIGLDYLEKHVPLAAWDEERVAFERICAVCSEASSSARPHVLSIHSVRAASDVLDILEPSGAAETCRCIFHWFSGSTDELWRAVRLGCWFSCNEMMMRVKRSPEYAKIIPKDRLLLETDYPPSGEQRSPETWADDIERSLLAAASALAAARSTTSAEIARITSENALALLG